MCNGFYQGFAMSAGTLPMLCVGELCWRRAELEDGTIDLVIDPNLQVRTLIEAGGGFLGQPPIPRKT